MKNDERGFTLIEMTVSLAIMSVVMTVVIGAITQIFSATHQVDSVSYDREQLTNAFRRLDTQLRYAAWVDDGAQVGTAWYVEYEADKVCHQLMYTMSDRTLWLYSWTPSSSRGSPVAVAGDLTLMGSVSPFKLITTTDTPYASLPVGTTGVGRGYSPEFLQLRIRFNATTGKVTIPFDTIFTAENTSRETSVDNPCSQARPKT